VGALRQTPAKPELQHLNQRADVASKLPGAASKVFGWRDEGDTLIVVVGDMRDALDVQPLKVTVAPADQATLPELG
jgi:hypothetical protein